MHVPKSGGTTLSHIFQKQLVGDVKNLLGKGGFADKTSNMALASIERDADKSTDALHLVFRGWRDWLDVQNNAAALEKKRSLIFEGGVWGAHSLLKDDRRSHYVFTIRDPINVFRSNFNYGMRRYSVHRSVEDYVDLYGSNLFTNILGHGCLELAKKRLEYDVSAFTLLEEFEASLKIIAETFEFSSIDFEVKNKSGSEKIEFSKHVERRFWEINKDDRELYDFSLQLLNKRLSLLKNSTGRVKISQNAGEGEFPKGFRNRNTEILRNLDEQNYEGAISKLDALPNKDFSAYLNLGRLQSRLGNFKLAASNFEKAFDSQPNVALSELVDCYLKFNPIAAVNKLEDELQMLKKIQPVEYFDALPNRELIALSEKLVSLLTVNANWVKAHDILLACLKLINGYPIGSWQNTQSGRSYKRLVILLIKISFKMGKISEARNHLSEYRKFDYDLKEVSLSRNKFLLLIAPVLCAGLMCKKLFGLRVSN